jgi:ribosomal protein L34E
MLIILLGVTCSALMTAVEVNFVDRDPVRMELPDAIGAWRGEKVWNCPSGDCGRQVMESQAAEGHTCPDCGEPLNGISVAEARFLPPDTIMRRSQYSRADGTIVNASVVRSGKGRTSIHRPQVCLTGGGNDITATKKIRMAFEDGSTLAVKVLYLTRIVPDERGRPMPMHSYYAYWFAGRHHETPHHIERMFWMAADKVIRSETYPWAYISLTGARQPGRDDHLVEIEALLREMVPRLRLPESEEG